MKQLKCEVLPREELGYYRYLAGQLVTVEKVSRDGGSAMARTDDGQSLKFYPEQLRPLDTSGVPATHSGPMLEQVWIFQESRHDAWDRCLPSDLHRYEKTYGEPWKDQRTWDVGKLV